VTLLKASRGILPLLNENSSGMYVAEAQADAYEFRTLRPEHNDEFHISTSTKER
jgi:hypothetical protein